MTPPDSPPDLPPGTPPRGYAVDWAHRTGAVDDVLSELAACDVRQRRRRTLMLGSAVAALLVVGFIFRAGLTGTSSQVPLQASSAVVSVPETRLLPDGSVVELRDGAEISVEFDAAGTGARRVSLIRGETHFSVAKNQDRPFIVTAGGLEVRAVGTAFSVELSKKQVEVIVTEGRVAVDEPGDAAPHALTPSALTLAMVDAGNRVVVPARVTTEAAVASIELLLPVQMTELMGWRQPRLEFSATPLSEAVRLFNQHNETQFFLADASIGELQISGFLRADKTDTFVMLLETDLGLKAEPRGVHEILLRRR